MKQNKPPFPRLDPYQIDIATRCALRWLICYHGAKAPNAQTIERFQEQATSAFLECERQLQRQWIHQHTRAGPRWRQDLRGLRRNPKRLRRFAEQEHLAHPRTVERALRWYVNEHGAELNDYVKMLAVQAQTMAR